MKLRVKATNETLPVAEDSFICGLRPDGSEVEFMVSDVELIPDNWDSFRREAAKDILVGIASSGLGVRINQDVAYSVDLADELIKQLREDEK